MKTTKKDIELFNQLGAQKREIEKSMEKLRKQFLDDALMYGETVKENSVSFSVGKKHHIIVTTSYPETFDKKTFEQEHGALYAQYLKTGKQERVTAKVDD